MFLWCRTVGPEWNSFPTPCPTNFSTTPKPASSAMAWMVAPILRTGVPGLQILIASARDFSVTSTRRCTSSVTFPTQMVREVSPWYPLR